MNKNIVIELACLLLICSTACTVGHNAKINGPNRYIPADKALYNTITHQDSLLFVAFNSRNIDGLKNFFAPDIEVYQDNIGVRRYDETVAAFAELFKKDYVLTRTLLKESLEIYPIKGFGAIETGRHTFCHAEGGKLECTTFKFMHIWQHKNDQWQLTRIITYDH